MTKTTLKLINPYTNTIKTAPLGFSWTVLFFAFLVPLYRKDWLTAFIIFVLFFPTFGLVSIIFAFFYNDIYASSLFNKGYELLYFWGPLKNKKLYSLMFNSFSDD